MRNASKRRQPAAAKRRDLDRTRRKILAAALGEFVARGFAGARTKAIAKRAGAHEWMVFYCFGSKQNLYREVMREKLAERTRMMADTPEDFADSVRAGFTFLAKNPDVVRLFQWETLTARRGEMLAAAARREAFEGIRARLRGFQERGILPPNADLELIWLSSVALAVFPFAFPQLVRLATDLEAADPAFQARWAGLLRRYAEHLLFDSGRIQGVPPARAGRAPYNISDGGQAPPKA